MRINLILVLLAILPVQASVLASEPAHAKLTITGGEQVAALYRDTRLLHSADLTKGDGDPHIMTVGGVAPGEILLLVVDGNASFIRPLAGDEITLNAGRDKWEFEGPQAQINNYLYQWTQQVYLERINALSHSLFLNIRSMPESNKTLDPLTLTDPETRKWMDGLYDELLMELGRSGITDRAFIREQEERIFSTVLELMLKTHSLAGYFGYGHTPNRFVLDYHFDDPAMIDHPKIDMLLSYYSEALRNSGTLPNDYYNHIAEQAAQIYDPAIRERFVVNELSVFKGTKFFWRFDGILDSVDGLVVSEDGRRKLAEVRKVYEDYMNSPANLTGKDAYPFELEDRDGNIVKMEDFRGKYVYIELWANWCGPCITELPHFKKLEHDLQGGAIAFVSISLNHPSIRQSWIDKMDELGLDGCNLISPNEFKYPMFAYYGIKTVPRFLLISPDGKVITANARRPSDIILRSMLKTLLED